MRLTSVSRIASFCCLVAVFLCWTVTATALQAIPPLSGHVIDMAATLSVDQKASLETSLVNFETRKGSQLAVLIVDSTAPEAIEQYSLRVAEQWKLGRKKIDDGAILVVAKADRALRIEVGYGLEGVLTDATAKRIISEVITPSFQRADFNGGIVAGLDQMMRVVDGEALPAPVVRTGDKVQRFSSYAPILLMLALVIGGVLRAILGRFFGAVITGGIVAGLTWFIVGALGIALIAGAIGLVFTLLSGGMGGLGILGASYGGNSHGDSSGGFSGGGGGFGGGGASGRW